MVPTALQSLAKGLVLLATMLALSPVLPARAADSPVYSQGQRVVELGIGKSYVVDLPVNAAEVLVADPKIANAVVRSTRKAYVIGVALGETDIIFFDAEGRQIESLAVSVGRDMSPIRNNIRASIPGATVDASAIGDSVMLTGSVKSAAEARTATEIAANLVGGAEKVVSAISIEGRDQVLLKVTVAEMQRSVVKQFGTSWNTHFETGNGILGFTSNPGFLVNDAAPGLIIDPITTATQVGTNGLGAGIVNGANSIFMNMEMLESNGLARVLAEPNITAVSGEKAEFLAGGEFPIPVAAEEDRITLEFKKFGVGLVFTPVVMSSGRISMQIGTEVSELTTQGAVQQNNFTIPGLTVRRASTTIELPSGGSYVMAGLLREDTRQAFEGLPGILNLPILGSLFRSRDYKRGQTELVIIVTPYLAKPNGRDKLARPDDGFSVPTDADSIFLGQLNRIYAPALAPAGRYEGPVGHILE